MMRPLIVDTGPLVALLSPRDKFHPWAKEVLLSARPPLLTCEPVLTETLFLLSRNRIPAHFLAEMFRRALLAVDFDFQPNQSRVFELLARYADVPMALTDGCLVCMSEITPSNRVATLDTDFLIYRRKNRSSVPMVMPKVLRRN